MCCEPRTTMLSLGNVLRGFPIFQRYDNICPIKMPVSRSHIQSLNTTSFLVYALFSGLGNIDE